MSDDLTCKASRSTDLLTCHVKIGGTGETGVIQSICEDGTERKSASGRYPYPKRIAYTETSQGS